MDHKYPKAATALLEKLMKDNERAVADTVKKVIECIDGGGLLYVFGSGHSSILVEEAFHRAGGLIPVCPILHSFLSPHTTPKISGKLERLTGIASVLFARSGARKGDLMFIASNSGINPAAIEMADECRKKEIPVVAFTSLAHSKKTPSRHASGKKLFELSDVVLDNHCPAGDAIAEAGGVAVGAGSTLANVFLYNWVITGCCEKWAAAGKKIPVYRSANTPGGDEHNEALEAPYRSRISLL